MNKLNIVYEDNDILVCHKYAGVATQTKRLGQQDMESLLKNYRAKKKESPQIWVVHRLDQPVEGLMVFAKNSKAAASLSKQIQARMIGKYYYMISAAMPQTASGVLEDWMFTDKKANFSKIVKYEEKDSLLLDIQKDVKKAKLEYQVVDTKEEKTLLRIKLHTGRQHQIRVQMAHMGCPLLGDQKYGKSTETDGLALCSYCLEFEHPTTKKNMKFEIVPSGKAFQHFFK